MGYLDFYPLKILSRGLYALAKDRHINFDESDLARMEGAFNALKPMRPAPVVIGHPETDAPSFGEVTVLKVVDGDLMGYAENLSDSFRRGLREEDYVRYAAQFYAPENPGNPMPGSWFLKHVGFMGKAPPIVRGFFNTDAQFMESLEGAGRKISPETRFGGPGCMEFSEFGIYARTPADIAVLARSTLLESAARGREISISEAVAAVRSMRGAR